MIIRATDLDGDWKFGNGKSDYLSANAAVGQAINLRLKSFLGDCFFALEDGIDWWNLLGSKNVIGLKLAINTRIANTQDVTRLIEVSSELDENRDLGINYSVDTVYSTDESVSGVTGISTGVS